jgi:hypothetical protein
MLFFFSSHNFSFIRSKNQIIVLVYENRYFVFKFCKNLRLFGVLHLSCFNSINIYANLFPGKKSELKLISKKSLKILKDLSETLNGEKTDNKTTKRKQ